MIIQDWLSVSIEALQQVWAQVVMFIPSVVGAFVIFIIGLIVAAGLGSLVEKVIGLLKIDSLVAKTGIDKEFERAGLGFDVAKFLGRATYWFFLIVTLLAVGSVLVGSQVIFGSTGVSGIFQPIILYIPKVIAAVAIVLIALILAKFLRVAVSASVVGARLHAAKFLGSVAWWIVFVLGILTALKQLEIGDFLVSIAGTVITGLVFMVALAGGIAFGLGGKDAAAAALAKMRESKLE